MNLLLYFDYNRLDYEVLKAIVGICDRWHVGPIFAVAISQPANILNVIFIRPESDDIATND